MLKETFEIYSDVDKSYVCRMDPMLFLTVVIFTTIVLYVIIVKSK